MFWKLSDWILIVKTSFVFNTYKVEEVMFDIKN